MKLLGVKMNPGISAIRSNFHPWSSSKAFQAAAYVGNMCTKDFIKKLLDRRWTLEKPDTKIHKVLLSMDDSVGKKDGLFGDISFLINRHPSLADELLEKKDDVPSFYVVRDDLLHPLVNGNKARKLDALLPLLEDYMVTDVVTCGGCQSAHAAAVAVSCAERGLKTHLLLRGEQPDVLTGYNLISSMYANVSYVPRSHYARRSKMLKSHADFVAGSCGSVVWLSDVLDPFFSNYECQKHGDKQMFSDRLAESCQRCVVIINEGAGDAVALLGVIRLVEYLSQIFGKERNLNIVIDAGTGTTAVGLGLGAVCLGLPWEITAVMLADSVDGYVEQEKRLISDFKGSFGLHLTDHELNKMDGGLVHWVDRSDQRRFGNILDGEAEACQLIAQQTGILLDPVYTLAAWNLAMQLSKKEPKVAEVVMLHTGGTLGMFGLAQRYKSQFGKLQAQLPV